MIENQTYDSRPFYDLDTLLILSSCPSSTQAQQFHPRHQHPRPLTGLPHPANETPTYNPMLTPTRSAPLPRLSSPARGPPPPPPCATFTCLLRLKALACPVLASDTGILSPSTTGTSSVKRSLGSRLWRSPDLFQLLQASRIGRGVHRLHTV